MPEKQQKRHTNQPVLDISVGDSPPVRFTLRDRRLGFGRSPFNDLTFEGEDISRRHFELVEFEGVHSLKDLSGRGTKVNGESVSVKRLESGDEISLGDVCLRYTFVELGQVSRTAPFSDKTAALDGVGEKRPGGWLSWESGGKTERLEINRTILIGADEDSHIVLDDSYVSKRHCQLLPGEQGAILRDLQSKNGTWIGDLRVGEVLLPKSCTFRIGQTNFQFEGEAPREQADAPEPFYGMVGNHPSMINIQKLITRVAPLNETVLILGETGTGKELAARALHELSNRNDGPFVAVNCGAIAGELVESELFGHEKGAFTGAGAKRKGAFQSARGGTIFLDEIGELPLHLQAKLLRTLDSGEIKSVGSDKVERHNARVMAATNRDLSDLVMEKRFRQDLFYRLMILPIKLPALRDRREDIPLLIGHFLGEAGYNDIRLSDASLDVMTYYYWPGNIRELKNVLTTSLCYHPEVAERNILDERHLVLNGPGTLLSPDASAPTDLKSYGGQTLHDVELGLIQEALTHYGGNKRLASRALGISKSTLYEKIKRHCLEV